MFKCVATMWHNGMPVDLHLFPVPTFGDAGFHRTIRTYETFRKRNNTDLYHRTLAAHKPGGIFIQPPIRASVKDKDEWDFDFNYLNKSLKASGFKVQPEPDFIEHASIYEFFEAIGYDYKTHRWVQPEDREAFFAANVSVQMETAATSFARNAKRYSIQR